MKDQYADRIRSACKSLMQDRKKLVRILTVLLILMLSAIFRMYGASASDVTVNAGSDSDNVNAPGIYVDIGGAVVKPGVYEVSSDTRLYEVIEMAGGLTSNADIESINRASFVEDGEKIIIPVKYVQPEGSDLTYEQQETVDQESGSSSLSSSEHSEIRGTGLININTATAEELKTLNGIGDKIAQRIIEYRTGTRFRDINDIKSVKGIGDSIFDKIKDDITV